MFVECCSEPAVAVTVMVEVVGWWGGGVEFAAPPQAVSAARPKAPARIRTRIDRRRLFFQPMQQRIAARAAPDESGPGLRWSAAEDALEAMVSVVEASVAEGAKVGGEKVQDDPEGRPEQANETMELKPSAGVTAMEAVPVWPAVMVNAVGDAATEKSGGRLM